MVIWWSCVRRCRDEARSGVQFFACRRPSRVAFFLDRFHQPGLNVLRNRLRFHPFENLDGLLRRVVDNPAIRAFGNMPLQLGLLLWIERIVEEIVQLLQKLLTGKQTRRPPFAGIAG